jgi:hypothetical protein
MGEALPGDDLHGLLKFFVSDQLRVYLRKRHTQMVMRSRRIVWLD